MVNVFGITHVPSLNALVGNDGYPIYMHKDDVRKIQVRGSIVDNYWIVPFNTFLSMKFKAHVNVEFCSTITVLKYLYKYKYKGHDRATIKMQMINHMEGQRVTQSN